MPENSAEIIYIHTVPNRENLFGPYLKSSGRWAPLGASCLSASFDARTEIIDLQDNLPEERMMPDLAKERVRAIFVQGSEDWNDDYAGNFANCLECIFPSALRILVTDIFEKVPSGWHVTLFGTGFTLTKKILAGFRAHGFLNTMTEDLYLRLSTTICEGISHVSYEADVEKSGPGVSIQVFRPWLGLAERFCKVKSDPPTDWLDGFMDSIASNGFKCIHFEYPFSSKDISASLAYSGKSKGLRVSLVISGDHSTWELYAHETFFRLWFSSGNDGRQCGSKACDNFLPFVKNFCWKHKDSISSGLVVDCCGSADSEVLESLAGFDYIQICSPGSCSAKFLKSVTLRFYLTQMRFLRRLLSVRNVSELVRVMKSAYCILKVILQ